MTASFCHLWYCPVSFSFVQSVNRERIIPLTRSTQSHRFGRRYVQYYKWYAYYIDIRTHIVCTPSTSYVSPAVDHRNIEHTSYVRSTTGMVLLFSSVFIRHNLLPLLVTNKSDSPRPHSNLDLARALLNIGETTSRICVDLCHHHGTFFFLSCCVRRFLS